MNAPLSPPIVILINSLMRGGAQRLAIHDINELMRRGIDVRLITLEAERPHDSMMEECHLPADKRVCISFSTLSSLRGWWQLISLLRSWKPQLLITHLWFSNTVGRISAMLARVPVRIAFEHNVYEGIRHAWQYVLDRWLARHTTYVVAVSEAVRQFLLKHDMPEARMRVIRNAIDLKPTAPLSSRAEQRRVLSIPLDTCVLLCVGRLIPQKGIDVLLRVFATLPEGMLLIVGDGTERRSLERMIDELQLGSRVQLLGTRKDTAALMQAADLFVLPSRWEGLPMVVLEAMAAKLPIVASAVDGTREVLIDQETALLVTPESEQELRQALSRAMGDPALRHRLQTAAFLEVQNYSVAKHVDQLLKLAES